MWSVRSRRRRKSGVYSGRSCLLETLVLLSCGRGNYPSISNGISHPFQNKSRWVCTHRISGPITARWCLDGYPTVPTDHRPIYLISYDSKNRVSAVSQLPDESVARAIRLPGGCSSLGRPYEQSDAARISPFAIEMTYRRALLPPPSAPGPSRLLLRAVACSSVSKLTKRTYAGRSLVLVWSN